MLKSTSSTRFIDQVTFGHAYIIRAEDTFARTGIWFGEYGYRRYTRETTHRLHADAFYQSWISLCFPLLDLAFILRNQNRLRKVTSRGDWM